MKQISIGVVGLSHLGIVTSVVLASKGFQILGVDFDAKIVDFLKNGNCMLPEPGIAELFQKTRSRFSFTADFSELQMCQIIFFGQDMPVSNENEMQPDLLHDLIGRMIPNIREGATIIFMSQVPVGFTRRLSQQIKKERPGLSFDLRYMVDTIVVGDAIRRLLEPERIIVGSEKSGKPFGAAFRKILESFTCDIISMNYESAEMTKAAMNLYLATTVTFANSLATFCERVGADMHEIIPALRLDKRVGPSAYIQPGMGLSGGHLERDVVMLSKVSQSLGLSTELFSLIIRENELRFHWLTNKIESEIFARNPHPKIAIWGLAYKKNTDSTHGAPSAKIMKRYAKRATFSTYDPLLRPGDPYAALDGADALLILNNNDEFKKIDTKRLLRIMKDPLIIDPAGMLSHIDFRRSGITTIIMGRGIYEKWNAQKSSRYHNRREPRDRHGNRSSVRPRRLLARARSQRS